MSEKITGKQLQKVDIGSKLIIDGKQFDLVLDFNAICEMEDKYGSFDEATKVLDLIGKDFTKSGTMKDIRFLLYVMMKHSDPDMTENEAGRLLTMNNMQEAMNAIGQAMSSGGTTGKKA